METVTIELKHASAKKLLKDLEELEIIRLIEPSTKKDQVTPSKLRGFLPKEKADALLAHISDTRNEWEERFPAK